MIASLSFPVIIAHRGYSAEYPENTLAAFSAAVDIGVRMIELDVTLSRDRQVVVIHDDTLDRTTSGRGRVGDCTISGLKSLDAGSWFHPRFSRETIPTLEEVLNRIPAPVCINIEIKPEAVEKQASDTAIELQVLRIVRENHAEERVLISSFEPEALSRISRINPELAIAFLTERNVHQPPLRFLSKIRAFSWNPDFRVLTRTHLETLHREGIRVFTYTVNSPNDMTALVEMGTDGFFTDNPLLAENLL